MAVQSPCCSLTRRWAIALLSPSIFIWCSLSPREDGSHIGWRAPLLWYDLNISQLICNNPFSKQGHTLRYEGVSTLKYFGVGHNSTRNYLCASVSPEGREYCHTLPSREGCVLAHVGSQGHKLTLGTYGSLCSRRRSWERRGDSFGHGSGYDMASRAGLEKPPDWSASCVVSKDWIS